MQLKSFLQESETALEVQKRKAYELQDALLHEFYHDDIVIDAVRLPADLAEEGFGVHLKFNSLPYWTKGTEFYLRGLLTSYELYRVIDGVAPRNGRMEQLGGGFHIATIDRAIGMLCTEIMFVQGPSDFLSVFAAEYKIKEHVVGLSSLKVAERNELFKALVNGKKALVKTFKRGEPRTREPGYDLVFQSMTAERLMVLYVEQ